MRPILKLWLVVHSTKFPRRPARNWFLDFAVIAAHFSGRDLCIFTSRSSVWSLMLKLAMYGAAPTPVIPSDLAEFWSGGTVGPMNIVFNVTQISEQHILSCSDACTRLSDVESQSHGFHQRATLMSSCQWHSESDRSRWSTAKCAGRPPRWFSTKGTS